MMADTLKESQRLACLSPDHILRELLAVIHGDGGHRADDVGLARATAEAMEEYRRLYYRVDALGAALVRALPGSWLTEASATGGANAVSAAGIYIASLVSEPGVTSAVVAEVGE